VPKEKSCSSTMRSVEEVPPLGYQKPRHPGAELQFPGDGRNPDQLKGDKGLWHLPQLILISMLLFLLIFDPKVSNTTIDRINSRVVFAIDFHQGININSQRCKPIDINQYRMFREQGERI